MSAPARLLGGAVSGLGPLDGVVRTARPGLAYVETSALVVAVEHVSAPPSPNGVYVDETVDLGAWTVGSPARLERGQLSAAGLAIAWDETVPTFDGTVTTGPFDPEIVTLALLEALALPGRADTCPVCRLVGDHQLWLRPPVLAALHALALRHEDAPFDEQHLDVLLGLGRGLTPETDDLLCAALLAQTARGLKVDDALAQSVLPPRARTATTALSGTWLSLASTGQAVGPLLLVLGARPGSFEWISGLRQLLAVGATTGRSMAVGATLGMAGHGRRAALEACKLPVGTGSRSCATRAGPLVAAIAHSAPRCGMSCESGSPPGRCPRARG